MFMSYYSREDNTFKIFHCKISLINCLVDAYMIDITFTEYKDPNIILKSFYQLS